jgi:hypothetical protein
MSSLISPQPQWLPLIAAPGRSQLDQAACLSDASQTPSKCGQLYSHEAENNTINKSMQLLML